MAEYIERQKVLDFAKTFSIDICSDEEYFLAFAYVETNDIKSIPAADVRPVVRGRLIKPNPFGECSICGFLIDIRDNFNFCPNCGADMREES